MTTNVRPEIDSGAPSFSRMSIDVSSPFRLDGRVAIVTGASSGLGDRFARVLHAAGAIVVVAARRADRLEALVEELGERAAAVRCVGAVHAHAALGVAPPVQRFGRVDVLVNNAGIDNAQVAAEHEAMADFQRVVDVNLRAPFLLSQLAARQMLQQGSGTIVNVASMLGLVASAPVKNASYCATKGGVINLTRELAVQWARKGVRVNALAPGWFPSEMTAEMVADDSSNVYVKRNCPMARFGAAEELDGALLFLASDASSYVTGQVLAVDGGWTAR
jgi:NAD(P)-dependent dehydrogenase (short-subunit alcohol dehydrogenase family)